MRILKVKKYGCNHAKTVLSALYLQRKSRKLLSTYSPHMNSNQALLWKIHCYKSYTKTKSLQNNWSSFADSDNW